MTHELPGLSGPGTKGNQRRLCRRPTHRSKLIGARLCRPLTWKIPAVNWTGG